MKITPEIQKVLLKREPGRAVLAALESLIVKDNYLLEVDANERSITHRFGIYLQEEMSEYDVDCEYNRNQIDTKQIEELYSNLDPQDTEGRTVFPDLIAHKRGTMENYLVIECKKNSSSLSRSIDIEKLRCFKADPRLNYEYALFVEFSVGEYPGVLHVEWVDA